MRSLMSMLVGYALVNNCIRTPLYERAQELLQHLRQTGQLTVEARVASNSLVCLAPTYQGKGLMPLLLAQLNQQLASHYDVLYATVHRSNLRSMRYHQREGYQQIGQDAARVYFLKAINAEQTGPVLSPGVCLRPGRLTDVAALHDLNR
jgi:GNAT superfamily N-acetyltransferase